MMLSQRQRAENNGEPWVAMGAQAKGKSKQMALSVAQCILW